MEQRTNPFLTALLAQQQDGKGAVSAPNTWDKEPLLHVETELEKLVDGLVEAIATDPATQDAGPWYFFVGSPGNGKSAATGHLARGLLSCGFSIADQEGTPLSELPATRPPYLLKVYAHGQAYSRAWIAQDASVLPDPYSPDADPATELVSLMEDAAARGIALVVCTNRGVLEKAYAKTYLLAECNKSPWFKAIQIALGLTDEGQIALTPPHNKHVYQRIAVSSVPLDRRSLLLKSDAFERLIVNAVGQEHWAICSDCVAESKCPFKQNAQWLRDAIRRTAFVTVMRRAELYSGKVIVFREAVALLSTILAGCPADYDSGGPCEWVHARLSRGDHFSLLARRIYAVLFSAYAPVAFEVDDSLRSEQLASLARLRDTIAPEDDPARVALTAAIDAADVVSTDLGTERLLGRAGVLRELDQLNDLILDDFLDRWGEGAPEFVGEGWASDLERACASHWRRLRDVADNSPESDRATHHWLLRWCTAMTYRAGALSETRTRFTSELDELIEILEGRATNVTRRRELRSSLTAALRLDEQGAEVSRFAFLKGRWATQQLSPQIASDPADASRPKSLALVVKFQDREFLIPGTAYVWLRRQADWVMLTQCFPGEVLETATDALATAAIHSNYDLVPNDVELTIKLRNGVASMVREGNEVIVDGL